MLVKDLVAHCCFTLVAKRALGKIFAGLELSLVSVHETTYCSTSATSAAATLEPRSQQICEGS